MSIGGLLQPVKQYFAFDNYHVESFMFTLNTKITTGMVLVCALLVTANQFIGDPIDCFVDKKHVVPPPLMDTYCWIHSTFTLPSRVTGPHRQGLFFGTACFRDNPVKENNCNEVHPFFSCLHDIIGCYAKKCA